MYTPLRNPSGLYGVYNLIEVISSCIEQKLRSILNYFRQKGKVIGQSDLFKAITNLHKEIIILSPQMNIFSSWILYNYSILMRSIHILSRGRLGRDCMVVWITTTYVINTYHHQRGQFEPRSGKVYSIQQYLIKFVSDFQQGGGFLRVLRFPPLKKMTATI